MEGRVKWFNRAKGYGFIVEIKEDGTEGDDFFVHHSVLPEGTVLNENDQVSFEASQNERGKQAKNVKVL